MKKLILLVAICLFHEYCIAQNIRLTGSAWTPTITTITEAGNDYASTTLTSASNQTLLDVKVPNISGTNRYIINIRRTDSGTNWNTAGLQLWVRRTSDGTGAGAATTVVGGTTYQQITSSDLYFFEGFNDNKNYRTGISIQYQITGASVLVPVANYSTTITFTLIDI